MAGTLPYFPIDLPPGVVRGGTEYKSKGRWYDTHLVRWYEAGGATSLGPIQGWAKHSGTAVTGTPRAIINWRDDSSTRWVGIGTHSKLYVMNASGSLFDITPAGFTAGRSSSTAGTTGYGSGSFGTGVFGAGSSDITTRLPATVWDLATFGQYLDGCSEDDGKIYEWQLSTGTLAAVITNAPTGCIGLVVTPQRFLFALGAGGNKRKVQWCDQEDNTTWTPTATNQAGDLDIPSGTLRCGAYIGEQTLVLSDLAAHIFDYVGLPYVYSRRQVGNGCGAISKRCIVATGPMGIWWSDSGFWVYDGACRPIPCDVWDYLNTTLSQAQKSKISGWHNPKNQEAWWFWPSSSTGENDSYVKVNYKTWKWDIGAFGRGCGTEPGAFTNPMCADAVDGYVYDHEFGYLYTGAASPYARSGPIELSRGDNVMEVLGIIPDEQTSGQVSVNFHAKFWPNAPDSSGIGPATFDGTGYTGLRFSARQIEIVVTGVSPSGWRWGTPRLDLEKAGEA